MLLGIISDSHDNLAKIDAAVKNLKSLGLEEVLHAADYCTPLAALCYKALTPKITRRLEILRFWRSSITYEAC